MFEKKEKMYIDPKTGKAEWITIKKGLFKEKKSRTPVYDSLKPQIKAKQKAESKAKWDRRVKAYNNLANKTNKALDWLEGRNTIQTRKNMPRPPKKRYIIRNGVAYPVYKTKKRTTTKKKTRKQYDDPFDFKIRW
jgi:hypothetical protein